MTLCIQIWQVINNVFSNHSTIPVSAVQWCLKSIFRNNVINVIIRVVFIWNQIMNNDYENQCDKTRIANWNTRTEGDKIVNYIQNKMIKLILNQWIFHWVSLWFRETNDSLTTLITINVIQVMQNNLFS